MKKLSRSVTLHCPVCGNSQFSLIEDDTNPQQQETEDSRFICSDCKSIFTKNDLIQENQESIDDTIEDIKDEAINVIAKLFKRGRS